MKTRNFTLMLSLLTSMILAILGITTANVIAGSQADENMKNAETVHKRLNDEKQKEELRDKSHDFPRVKVSDDTSVGVDPTKNQINIKKTTP